MATTPQGTFGRVRDPGEIGTKIAGLWGGAVTPHTRYTHHGASDVFAHMNVGLIKYAVDTEDWLIWDGRRWCPNSKLMLKGAVKNFCAGLSWMADNDQELGRAARAKAEMVGSDGFTNSVISSLAASESMRVEHADFDANPWALNTPAGIVNLRTGLIGPHDPELMCTKITPVAPKLPNEGQTWRDVMPTFWRVLTEAFDPRLVRATSMIVGKRLPAGLATRNQALEIPLTDEETASMSAIRTWLKQFFGYCATGDVRIHAFGFFHGVTGRNGKNTIADAALQALGVGRNGDGYSIVGQPELFTVKRGDDHPTRIAQLFGARYVLASEVEEGSLFNSSMLKRLTGDDVLSGRFMAKDFFSFPRTHKMLILGNRLPRLPSLDEAFLARIKVVEFNVAFNKLGMEDPGVKRKIIDEELPAVLGWMIEGAKEVAETEQLIEVDAIQSAVKAFREESDELGQFFGECMMNTDTSSGSAKTSIALKAFQHWQRERGQKGAMSSRTFKSRLKEAGFDVSRGRGTDIIKGWALRPESDPVQREAFEHIIDARLRRAKDQVYNDGDNEKEANLTKLRDVVKDKVEGPPKGPDDGEPGLPPPNGSSGVDGVPPAGGAASGDDVPF